MSRMDPVQIAVAGRRRLGQEPRPQFPPDSGREPQVRLRPRPEKARPAGPAVAGSTLTRDFDAVLRDPDIQAVVIATPGPRHFPLAKMALESGKDVYVEKPFTLEIAHAEELIALAEREQARADGRAPARVPPGRHAAQGDDRPRGAWPPVLHLQPAREPRHGPRGRERALELRAARYLGDHVPARRSAHRRRGPRPELPAERRRGRRIPDHELRRTRRWPTCT